MSRIIKLKDGGVEVGVIPDLGGMVALLHVVGSPNILKFDRGLWDEEPVINRTFGPNPRWKANNGQIVWVGPQSEWWVHQTVSPKMRRKRSVWPPDPYLDHGYFEVIERSDTEVVMRGPESEFTGVQLTKSVRMIDGVVLFTVKAENIRRRPVSWDLWLNMRVDGYARCYVPVGSTDKVRIEGEETNVQDKTVFFHDRGYFSIDARIPLPHKTRRCAKAFIPANKGAMAAFFAAQALIVRFKRHSSNMIHPEHSLVELYNHTSHVRDEALTELEYHAPYVTLEPGESMEAVQQWEVYPFKSRSDHHECCLEFLNEMI